MEQLLWLFGGVIAGSLTGWVIAASRARAQAAGEHTALQSQLAVAQSTQEQLRAQSAAGEQQIGELRQRLDGERQSRARLETQLEESGRRLEEQRRLLDDAEKKLKESFEALSAKALQSNAEQFLASAKKTLETLLAEARGDLGKREEAIKTLVQPLADSLKRYETQVQTLEQTRRTAYVSLEQEVKRLALTNQQLQQETGKLVTALRDPKVRGRWGELALRRAAELAGMIEHCDFEQQVSFSGEDGRMRPDMVVRLPGGRTVVVDAKTVLDAYLDAVAAADEATRQDALRRHAAQVRSRLKELASKSYWKSFPSAPEFVVLFLPGESFFSAALETDATLIEDAVTQRVVLASPTTLIALLRAIAYGWRQEQFTENAERISELGRELFDRIRTFTGYMENLGGSLGTAVKTYNQAVGSLESRVLTSARRFRELGAGTGDEIPEVSPVDRTPRALDVPESPA